MIEKRLDLLKKKKAPKEKQLKVNKVAKAREKGKAGSRFTFHSIRTRILLATAIPFLFMCSYGIISYNRTADAIISNYEINALDSLNATQNNMWIGLESASALAYNLVNRQAVTNYYNRFDKLTAKEAASYYNAIKEEVLSAKTNNNYIYNVHIFGEQGNSYSTSGELDADYFDKFIQSEQGASMESSTNRIQWIGQHEDLDESLGNIHKAYSMALIRKMSENNGYIVVDVPSGELRKSLNQINYGEGSILGILTEDGYQTLAGDTNIADLTAIPFFADFSNRTASSGYQIQRIDEVDYLLLYSQLGNSKAIICAMIPQDTILAKAESIKDFSRICIIVNLIVSLAVGIILSSRMGNEFKKLTKRLAVASKGDLTTVFETKRKDEFKVLVDNLNDMLAGMRTLITEVSEVGNRVNDSAIMLSDTSDTLVISTQNISAAIDEIGEGVVQQASDTEQCSDRMGNLAEKIAEVYNSTYEIEQIATGTKRIIKEGTTIVEDLNEKSLATNDITNVVIEDIEDLEEQSKTISQFIKIINGIANQTNLLSLNASIEAARAGEAGRGFSVVAEEIRKLADDSLTASNQIRGIVSAIQDKTKITVGSAKKAKSIVESQMDALKKTVDSFEQMTTQVNGLVNHINDITTGVKSIEDAKDSTVDAIMNISAVAQESAASAEEVRATSVEQISATEKLSNSAHKLKQESSRLEAAIQTFKI